MNNIRVSFLAFTAGLLLGLGTVAILFYNGLLLGSLTAMFLNWKLSLSFWALILPHGVIELPCIFIAGGAGLLLGGALLVHRSRSRKEALQERGLVAVRLALGIVPLLAIAAAIEGFITPLTIIGPYAKLGFALLAAAALGVYLLRGRSA